MESDELRFVSLLLNALASGVVLSHVLERPGKLALAPATYLEVQQTFFKTYGVAAGLLETLALLATAAWWVIGRIPLVGVAALADAAMILVSAVWINPINLQVNRWRADSLPVDWVRLRDRRGDAAHDPRDSLTGCAGCVAPGSTFDGARIASPRGLNVYSSRLVNC